MVAGGHLRVPPSVKVLRECLTPIFFGTRQHSPVTFTCLHPKLGVFPCFPFPLRACLLWDAIQPGFPQPGAHCASQAGETKGESTEMTLKNPPGFMELAALPNTSRKSFPFHVIQGVSWFFFIIFMAISLLLWCEIMRYFLSAAVF